jgi:hypothetical protein
VSSPARLSGRERQIFEILYKYGKATVSEVRGANRRSKALCIEGNIEPLVMPAVDQRTDVFSVRTNEVHQVEMHEWARD